MVPSPPTHSSYDEELSEHTQVPRSGSYIFVSLVILTPLEPRTDVEEGEVTCYSSLSELVIGDARLVNKHDSLGDIFIIRKFLGLLQGIGEIEAHKVFFHC